MCSASRRSHPHVCGEQLDRDCPERERIGSSPRVRGREEIRNYFSRFIPAGTDTGKVRPAESARDSRRPGAARRPARPRAQRSLRSGGDRHDGAHRRGADAEVRADRGEELRPRGSASGGMRPATTSPGRSWRRGLAATARGTRVAGKGRRDRLRRGRPSPCRSNACRDSALGRPASSLARPSTAWWLASTGAAPPAPSSTCSSGSTTRRAPPLRRPRPCSVRWRRGRQAPRAAGWRHRLHWPCPRGQEPLVGKERRPDPAAARPRRRGQLRPHH